MVRRLRATAAPLVRAPRRARVALLAAVAAVLAAGCPVRQMPTRDGGTACTATAECNPSGQTCGAINLCVQNVCTAQPVVRACFDAAVDAAVVGDCLTIEDCNPRGACGLLVQCTGSYRCDPDAGLIEIPCEDGGADDAGDAAAGDARASDGGGGDARAADDAGG